MTQVHDVWIEEVVRGNMIGVILCDQSAAFDLCDHHLLIEKFKLLGVKDREVGWLTSYLSERKQSCKFDGNLSHYPK